MIAQNDITIKEFRHDPQSNAPYVPPGCRRVVARLVLEHDIILDEQAVRNELIGGLHDKLKRAILRKIYGGVAKKMYEKRGEVLICVPAPYLFKATEAFNDILELLPDHARYSIPEWMTKSEKEMKPHDL